MTSLLSDLLLASDIPATIECRVKSPIGFADKVARKGYATPFVQMTDIVGIRVILRTLADVQRVAELLAREFEVDWENSVSKVKQLDPDRFGYLSDHYILRLKPPRTELVEWQTFSGMWAEVQVRTIVQHAWAAIQHALDYKSTFDIPKTLRRRLFRLSALFELADEELDSIAAGAGELLAQYRQQISSNATDIELNLESIRAYLEESVQVSYWADLIRSWGVEVNPPGMIARDLEMAREVGIKTVAELDDLILCSKSWGEPYLHDYYKNTFGKLPPSGCSSDVNGIVTLFLIGNYLEVFTDEELPSRWGWGEPQRATVPAKQYNPKYCNPPA
nr:hypothetical protein [Synechococcus sp. FACHB-909]